MNAAAGPDQFSAALLKQCEGELSALLLVLYRNSLQTGKVPQCLKKARITPIFKGGSRTAGEAFNSIPRGNAHLKHTSAWFQIRPIVLDATTGTLRVSVECTGDQY